ncbi:MAG: bacteriophage abortive infection AbiH family protein [Bacteroidales bacterium]|nr:bacteriophage abortive infection AbiH family protein [Bacteroidales bacterium]
MYSRFKYEDFTKIGSKAVIDDEYSDMLEYVDDDIKEEYLFEILRDLEVIDTGEEDIIEEKIKGILLDKENNQTIFPFVPKQILFLNFNYTHTEYQYYLYNYFKNKKLGFQYYLYTFLKNICENLDVDKKYGYLLRKKNTETGIIHIHGELKNEKNSIIFGYGDEIAEEYKAIEKKNDNRFLENIKSIRYLETDNYKRLLDFINSDKYQIFVMGHSCGISDRTLLNTLFEHENCVSIKPFYYEYKDENGEIKNDYSDKVRNISRNFTDKKVMREKVVNEAYCEPLLDCKTK